MVKRGYLFFLAGLFLILQGSAGTITGEATSDTTTVSLTVLASPALNLLSPENKTYLNTTILLNYTESSSDNLFYNIDDGTNITITESTNIVVSEGDHTLKLYANNSLGTTIRSSDFTANTSKINIIYNEYAGSKKGDSTDFNSTLTYEALQILEDVILENTDWGKIEFSETINLTDDLVFGDGEVDLDGNTNISENSITINSTALPNLNKSATIYLYNLTYSNPRILMDGEICSSAICTKISYSGGTLKFNVTQFTTYSSEETPAGEVAESSTSPQAGGSSKQIIEEQKFYLDKETISAEGKPGMTIIKEIEIFNQQDNEIKINLKKSGLEEILSIFGETEFNIKPLGSKKVRLQFKIPKDKTPDIYLARLKISSEDSEKIVPISLEVKSEEELFYLDLQILSSSKKVSPGERLNTKITMDILGNKEKDTKIEYIIKSGNGEIIYYEEEYRTLSGKTEFLKNFDIPAKTIDGNYILYVRTISEEKMSSKSQWFVSEEKFEMEIGLIILSTLIVILIIILLRKIRRKKKRRY